MNSLNTPRTLYLSDLDGTLLNENIELSGYTKEILNRLAAGGASFSIATARTYETVKFIFDGVRLNTPIILMNGVLIYDTAKGEYIKRCPLSAQAVSRVVRELERLGITGMMYELSDSTLLTYYEDCAPEQIRSFVEERVTRYNKRFEMVRFADVAPENIIYFAIIDKYEKIAPMRDALLGMDDLTFTMYNDIYSENQWYLEIFSTEASKYNATKYLRETCGFERIVSFGDNLNDLPLFDASDYKIAVSNAKDEVKSAADFICGPNTTDSVAKWLAENAL